MSTGYPESDARRSDLLGALRTLGVPLIPGVLLVVGTYALWQYSAQREQAVRGAMVESEAGRIQEELARALDRRAAALAAFAASNPAASYPEVTVPAAPDSQRAEAEFTRAGLPFRAVLALDSTLAVTRVLPAAARLTPALDSGDDEGRTVALRVITEIPGRAPSIVSTAPLSSGGRELLVCAPLLRDGRIRGFLVGVDRLRDVMDEVLSRTVRQGFATGIYDGPELVYGSRLADGGSGIGDARETAVVRDAVVWRIEVWPADELTRRLDPRAPAAVFVLGMLLALFVSLCVYMWREEGAAEPATQGAGRAAAVEPGPSSPDPGVTAETVGASEGLGPPAGASAPSTFPAADSDPEADPVT